MTKFIEETAQHVLDVVPLVMRTIRAEFRGQHSRDLSVPQFRTLAFVRNNDGASLSSLASYIGLTLPSMSKLIDGLVQRGLVARNSDEIDRRKVCLKITGAGQKELASAYDHTQDFLVTKLSSLSKQDLTTIHGSMQILNDLFESQHPEKSLRKATT